MRSIIVSCLAVMAAQALAADAPKTFKVGEFSFTRPATWEWVNVTSPMRQAQLKVPGKDGKNADVIFFYFGESGGGGAKANVDRWLGHFEEPRDKINARVDETKVNNRTVTYVQAEGTYKSGMPGGPTTPQPNTMLLGAILESPKGNVFIRMTGPSELAKASRDDFKKMVDDAAKSAGAKQ
jgi:hypothetical protein